jgi:D-alanyl-lipoteichoic acid acyltransferase DltB (MBOAT superfamily)
MGGTALPALALDGLAQRPKIRHPPHLSVNFTSLEYAVFFAIVLVCYWQLGRRAQSLFLLLASYVFYAFWDVRFVALICVTTYVHFVAGNLLSGQEPASGSTSTSGAPSQRRALWAAHGFLLAAAFGFVTCDLRAPFTGHGELLSLDGFRGLAPLAALALIGLAVGGERLSRRWLERSRRRLFLGFGVLCSVGLLVFFKYAGFFVTSAHELLGALGFSAEHARLDIVLPLGLSFYTFQALGYTVDVYRGRQRPAGDLLAFATFVAYFPQVVSGPISRAQTLLPQLEGTRQLTKAALWSGSRLLLVGALKKVAIADSLAASVEAVFGNANRASGADVVIALILFSIQIVCDFSGYTDMARGCSRLLGIELDVNFSKPYLASNPQEFWRRWHMSLSSWLRDYVYIPLGGNRRGPIRQYLNLFATMLLAGLWHGAAWTFVLWGAFHGLLLCAYRLGQGAVARIRFFETRAGVLASTAWFYGLVCYGWLLFRARSVQDVRTLTHALFSVSGEWLRIGVPRPTTAFLLAVPAMFALMLLESRLLRDRLWQLTFVRGATYATMLVAVLIAAGQDAPAEFIYFQF